MRTDDSVVRSVSAAAARRRCCCAARAATCRSSARCPSLRRAGPRLRRRAEEHLLRRQGRRAGSATTSATSSNYETLESFREGVAHFQRLFAVEPEIVAHDLHPEYLSTRYALEREGVEHVGVQHHHAHLAACLAEHGEPGPAVGAIYDGTGYGPDGTVWGGELLRGGLRGFERAGLLFPVRLPGGDRAVARAVANGMRLADRGLRRPGAADPRGARGGRPRARLGRRSASWSPPASTRPSPPAPGGCSTRSPRSAGSAPRSTTRGRRRPSWRACRTRRSRGASPSN